MKSLGSALLCALLLVAAGCGGHEKDADPAKGDQTPESGQGSATSDGGAEAGEPEAKDPLADPKTSLKHQLDLLVKGDVEKLRACFTDRQKDRITTDTVKDGQQEAAKYTFDDLWASEEMGEYKGQKTCKIKMKNGRTLTTLVLTDGKWLADTVWFK